MTRKSAHCPFCEVGPEVQIWKEKQDCLALKDSFPVSEGHTLIIPKEHISSYFELDRVVQESCWDLVNEMKEHLHSIYKPEGFNVGINVGEAAGQTIWHAHIHLIPRYKGDTPTPRGGVRCVIPEKQSY